MILDSIRFQCTQLKLSDWSLIKVTGADRETFFQGQVTNDLSQLEMNQGHCTARLNRTGKLQSFFFLGKCEDALYLLSPKSLAQKIKSDFDKFIIMDEVELEITPHTLWLIFNPFLLSQKPSGLFELSFYGLSALLTTDSAEGVPLTNPDKLEEIRILNGWPQWEKDVSEQNFINDTFLNQVAISYKKGCFLGQETVAKIENNRGAAYYPMLLKLDTHTDLHAYIGNEFECEDRKAGVLLYQIGEILQVSLFRDFRVLGKQLTMKLTGQEIKAVVQDLPYFKAQSRQELSRELFHEAVSLFQDNKNEDAKSILEHALFFDPSYSDAYESLGVILGREEKYNEAIAWMDKLLAVNPQSVMAHTNKSLYLMKMGKIEEAEAEKSLATVKSFAMFGSEAKLKKQLEEEQKKKEEDLLRREKMFLQVLEIDPDDTIALYGMADIFFFRKEFERAATNLERVISLDAKYSNAYLLMGKSYEALAETQKAANAYQVGISIASKQGDMMPANEMQSRLNQLVMGPTLS